MKSENSSFLGIKVLILLYASISLVRGCGSPSFKQQIVLILDSDEAIHEVGKLLYTTHDTVSYVLMWNENLHELQHAKWNAHVEKFEVQDVFQQLPIGSNKPFSWMETVIKIIGICNGETFSGFSAENLITMILELAGDDDIGQIDAITTDLTQSSTIYLEFLMNELKNHKKYNTTVTFRSDIVVIDHSGDILRGQIQRGMNHSIVKWKHDTLSTQVCYHSFVSNQYQIQCVDDAKCLKSSYFGIIPSESDVYITEFKSPPNRPISYKITDKEAFTLVNEVAHNVYTEIPGNRAPATVYSVLLLPETQNSETLNVIEFHTYTDLLKELHYYGEVGSSDNNDTEVYYRFGNWVVSMNEATFYVRVIGVIENAPSLKKVQLDDIIVQWQMGQNSYPAIQTRTGTNFLSDIYSWINGRNSDIKMTIDGLFNAQCGVAMFLSESIYSFHSHITNMMCLDLARNNYMSSKYYFASHPMPSKITKNTGLDLLKNSTVQNLFENEEQENDEDEIKNKIIKITKSFISHVEYSNIKGSRHLPPAGELRNNTEIVVQDASSEFEHIGVKTTLLHYILRLFELQESEHRLLTTNQSDSEAGAIMTIVIDFANIDATVLSVKASSALINDHAYLSEILKTELQMKEQQTNKTYVIVPSSIEVDKESNIIKIFVQENSNPYSKIEQLKITIDRSQLLTRAMLKEISVSSTRDIVLRKNELIDTVEKITNSIHKLDGESIVNILMEAYSATTNLKVIADSTGISKTAEKILGKVLKPLSQNVSSSVFHEVGEIVKDITGDVKSLIGNFNKLKNYLYPLVQLGYGIYNIYQDFKRHTTTGYIEGGFDIATTFLSLLGPEAAPLEAALSLIKMGVEYFFTDISKELRALPPHASVGQITVAVLNGIFDGVIDILENIIHNINPFAVISDMHALDDIYNKNHELICQLSDYENYYNFVNQNGDDAAINFADSLAAWNGGSIEFHLGENGESQLSVQKWNGDGTVYEDSNKFNTSGIEDIMLGIGESHSPTFKTYTVYFMFVFPVDTKTVITGINEDKNTRHGTYYGNSHNNKFIAVQELPPETVKEIGYNLTEYTYYLYGGGGNDTFYLGPQHTFIEGNEGSDTYFISNFSTYTVINSHSQDGQLDTMIFKLNFTQLHATRADLDLNITSSNTHKIILQNWFVDVTHQRIIFKTEDGVVFKISSTINEEIDMIAYALSGSSSSKPVKYDSNLTQYSSVVTIVGSEYDDTLIGNDQDNHLNGGGGNDNMTGGNGKDTYTIDLGKGIDTIDNCATDNQTDNLIIHTNLDELFFSSHSGSNDLYITNNTFRIETFTMGVVIINWFSNVSCRHLTIITEDKSLIKVSPDKKPNVAYQSLIINMSDIEPQVIHGNPYTRKLDLNSNSSLKEVLTVFGTEGNDSIIGNFKDNYITGNQGFDYLEAREGADTYVVKEGDGNKIIMNCAIDTDIDTLLFDTEYDYIDYHIVEMDAVISGNDIEVTLKSWFEGERCQHMVIRSVDGITFELPSKSDNMIKKIPRAIDNSNLTSDIQIMLSGKWESVQRVIGSQGDDQIIGNSNDNYIDPGKGNSYLKGGNGSDTYVIQSTYGEGNIINNYAEDEVTDTILFHVPFLSIKVEVIGIDIRLTSLSGNGLVAVRILDYNFQLLTQARHLLVTTSDGITFVLPIATNGTSQPIPISINRAQANVGQSIDLSTHQNFSEVRSVFGSRYQNILIGNKYNNTIIGGNDRDCIRGGDGNDVLKGGSGSDTIDGGLGVDEIFGDDGDDTINGGKGDDVISPGSGSNQVDGGEGMDTIVYDGDFTQKGIKLDFTQGTCIHNGNFKDQLSNIENCYGTEYDDVIHGDENDNMLVGQGGNDHIVPGSGYDILNGGNGNDTYNITGESGTVIIDNYATDKALDVVEMRYADISQIWYEITKQDVILRVINSQYPVFYDGKKPTVVFINFLSNATYQHIRLRDANGRSVLLTELINPKVLPTAIPVANSTSTEKPINHSSNLYIICMKLWYTSMSIAGLLFVIFLILICIAMVRKRLQQQLKCRVNTL